MAPRDPFIKAGVDVASAGAWQAILKLQKVTPDTTQAQGVDPNNPAINKDIAVDSSNIWQGITDNERAKHWKLRFSSTRNAVFFGQKQPNDRHNNAWANDSYGSGALLLDITDDAVKNVTPSLKEAEEAFSVTDDTESPVQRLLKNLASNIQLALKAPESSLSRRPFSGLWYATELDNYSSRISLVYSINVDASTIITWIKSEFDGLSINVPNLALELAFTQRSTYYVSASGAQPIQATAISLGFDLNGGADQLMEAAVKNLASSMA